MKKFKTFATAAVLSTMMLTTSCHDDYEDSRSGEFYTPVLQQTATNDSISYNTYNGESVVYETNSEELSNAFDRMLMNKKYSVTGNTKLLVVNDLNAYFSDVEKVYDNGGVIALTSPSQAKIDAFFKNHPTWVGQWTESDINGALLYAFSNKGYHMVMADPNQSEYKSFELSNVDNSDGFFGTENPVPADRDVPNVKETNIDTSLPVSEPAKEVTYQEKVNDLISLWSQELTKRDSKKLAIGRAASRADDSNNNSTIDLASLADQEEYQVFHTFTADKYIGKIALSDPDYMRGSGALGITFKVTKLHAFEGNTNSGDYYMVHAETSISNENMYRGKGWWGHGLVYRRYCGFICDEFQYRMKPMFDGKIDETVKFPYGGSPMPQTTINKTTYKNAQSFSLNLSGSYTLTRGVEDNKAKIENEGKVEVATGWTWETSQECELSDVNIVNTSTENIVGHKVEFKNLPQFRWACDYGFDEGNSAAFRSTQVINSTWVWFKKGVKDNSKEKPLTFRFETSGKYHTLDFITTKADLCTNYWGDILNYSHDFQIRDFNRDKAFRLAIYNDTNESISHITVTDNKGNVVAQKRNSYRAGKELYIGSFPLKNDYTVTYVKGGKEYRYSLNKWVPAENGEETILNALNDFEEKA